MRSGIAVIIAPLPSAPLPQQTTSPRRRVTQNLSAKAEICVASSMPVA
jgi:hypothetical protein